MLVLLPSCSEFFLHVLELLGPSPNPGVPRVWVCLLLSLSSTQKGIPPRELLDHLCHTMTVYSTNESCPSSRMLPRCACLDITDRNLWWTILWPSLESFWVNVTQTFLFTSLLDCLVWWQAETPENIRNKNSLSWRMAGSERGALLLLNPDQKSGTWRSRLIIFRLFSTRSHLLSETRVIGLLVAEEQSAADHIPPCGEPFQPEERSLLSELLLWQNNTDFIQGEDTKAVWDGKNGDNTADSWVFVCSPEAS